jgi:hypothetical protein
VERSDRSYLPFCVRVAPARERVSGARGTRSGTADLVRHVDRALNRAGFISAGDMDGAARVREPSGAVGDREPNIPIKDGGVRGVGWNDRTVHQRAAHRSVLGIQLEGTCHEYRTLETETEMQRQRARAEDRQSTRGPPAERDPVGRAYRGSSSVRQRRPGPCEGVCRSSRNCGR